jgi:diguanylate cyclase (GGDEF)-like protein
MNSTLQNNRRNRLLLVDDDPDIHDLVAFMLDSQDIEITSAMDGRQAIEMAQSQPLDLILLDYSMPGENGLEIFAKLHAAGVSASIPVVFITAKESNRILAECFQAGAVDYIRKPFCLQELCARVRSVLDRRRMLKQLEQMALCDPLTELHNRRAIRSRIQFAIENSQNTNCAVLYLDFDQFKLVNDTLGHDAGDLLLQQIADRLRATLRVNDIVQRATEVMTAARIGGDEFVVLLENLVDSKDALLVADRLLTRLAVPYSVAGHEVHSTASVGIVDSLKRYQTPDQVLRDADTAMYEAKSAGKGRYVLFDPSMRAVDQDLLQTRSSPRFELAQAVSES